jgi:hypothetical protein
MKKLFKSILVGASMFALVGTTAAADIEINMYGASAQYLFWNDAADNFLLNAAYGNCATAQQAEDSDGKVGITQGLNCNGFGLTNGSIIIRYSAKASYDGIRALKGVDPDNACPGQPYYRPMADESQTNFGTGVVNGTKCVDVTMGNSDVAGESFVQSSTGQLKGPNGGGVISRSFSGIDTTGLDYYQPLVVPFGFFLNNSVTVTKCLSPDPTEEYNGTGIGVDPDHKAISAWGNVCEADVEGRSNDCIGYYKCVDSVCVGGVNEGDPCSTARDCPDVRNEDTKCVEVPLDNISRLMAVMIYSGQAWYWSDFGAWFTSDPIVACLRHAGSGTHATLDWAVMRGVDWGWSLVTAESASDPTVWFNDGSSDEMNCVDGLPGAIGYADADQLEGSKNYPNVHAVKYNGVEPRRWTIRNGWYDFWSAQWTYEDPNEPGYATKHPVVAALAAYAAVPGNIPGTKARYWATQDEMVYMKSSDKTYPGYQGASSPQTP